MIEQNVQVVRCSNSRMWVRMGSQSGCTACDKGNGCGAGVFAKLLQTKPVVMELACNDENIRVGQMVTLGFPEQVYLKLVFSHYGWPLLAAIAGAFVGYRLGVWAQFGPGMTDATTLLGALFAGGIFLRLANRGISAHEYLKSLQTTVYIPSDTPNMCNSVANQSKDN